MSTVVKRPSIVQLTRISLLRNLSEQQLTQLVKYCEYIHVPSGTRIFKRGKNDQEHEIFLLQGNLLLLGENRRGKAIDKEDADSPAIQLPLASEALAAVVTASEVRFIRIRRSVLDKIKAIKQSARSQLADKTASNSDIDAMSESIRQAIKEDKLELPTMPDISIRIARHLDDPDSDNASIARIIQQDPALTARIMQVANSTAFGARVTIESCRDAVSRLGRRVTRELITAFVLKNVFRTSCKELKEEMQQLWRHSTLVAALCHALSRKTGKLNPNQALLAGLVHDIGCIPIYNLARDFPQVVKTPGALELVVKRMRVACCEAVLSGMEFPGEIRKAAADAENWTRDTGVEADYADLVIIAQAHSYVGSDKFKTLPRLDTLPAFRKLSLEELSPRFSIQVLDEAEQEIRDIQRMFA